MSDSKKCPRCGSDLPANFPPGVCPTCLLQQGLSPNTYLSGTSSVSAGASSGRRRGWTPPTPAELAPRFPQLEIIELLGQGGMGAVYKVRQRELDRWAALKILPDEVAHDPSFSERFQREARALALLGHQHIVTVYEFGQRDGVYFLLMEYIDGVTLRQAIRAGQISAKDALAIVTQICDALQFAHEEGVVHRDIKPENILIDKRGRVKIADFGLAKLLGNSPDVPNLTGTHQVMGTPMYMAPEQMEGTRGVDHRADIFSLGVVFYELLTGELPLGRFAPPSQKYQLDVRLDDVVLRTLEKEPDRRYQQASDVKCDVESIRSQPRVAPLPETKKPHRTWAAAIGRIMMPIGFLATAVVTLILISFLVSMPAEMANHQRLLEQLAAAKQYEASVARFQAEKQAQQASDEVKRQLEAATLDPIEAEAIVQFTDQGPKLNAHYGADLMTTENRVILNQILARIHSKYLEIESRHRKIDSNHNGLPTTVVIKKCDDEVTKLENELWTEIDSQLPVAQQKFLRDTLPLYASDSQSIQRLSPYFGGAGGGSSMGVTIPQNMGMPPGMGMASAGMMGMGGMGSSSDPSRLRYSQLLGWKSDKLPIRFTIGRRGKWFRWTIAETRHYQGEVSQNPGKEASLTYFYDVDFGEAPELPSGLRRFWREITANEPQATLSEIPEERAVKSQLTASSTLNGNSLQVSVVESSTTPVDPGQAPSITLDEALQELQDLRAGEQTNWDEVASRLRNLLAAATTPEHRGKIHSHAAEIYSDCDMLGHESDVIFHAKQALKFERDPIHRSSMFIALGDAAIGRDKDPFSWVTQRDEATQWYIKGYAELLPFGLPDAAPELPVVEGIANRFSGNNQDEINAEQIAAEVRRAAQLKARREAEFTSQLVLRRDTYINRLRGIYARNQQEDEKESGAKEQFQRIADRVLRDPNEISKLMKLVWAEKPVEPGKVTT